ncbi:MAG TPA: hypothetical protein VHM19_18650 [Polyangiales bacterium]|jgi:hypothetical protein|nr:hypothetical protein [Polyangiales bacterium]
MTVSQLIAALQELPQDAPVMIYDSCCENTSKNTDDHYFEIGAADYRTWRVREHNGIVLLTEEGAAL